MKRSATIQFTSDRVVLTPQEFAALFGRSKTWTYRLIYAGIIHPLKGTPSVMIPTSEVERLVSDTGRYEGTDKIRKPVAQRVIKNLPSPLGSQEGSGPKLH